MYTPDKDSFSRIDHSSHTMFWWHASRWGCCLDGRRASIPGAAIGSSTGQPAPAKGQGCSPESRLSETKNTPERSLLTVDLLYLLVKVNIYTVDININAGCCNSLCLFDFVAAWGFRLLIWERDMMLLALAMPFKVPGGAVQHLRMDPSFAMRRHLSPCSIWPPFSIPRKTAAKLKTKFESFLQRHFAVSRPQAATCTGLVDVSPKWFRRSKMEVREAQRTHHAFSILFPFQTILTLTPCVQFCYVRQPRTVTDFDMQLD